MTLRPIQLVLPFALALCVAGQAHAQSFEGNVAFVSDYLFRGVTQTDGDPAIQGGFQFNHDSGVYAGAWGSSISWLSDSDPDVSSQVELNAFLGYAGEFGTSGVGYDVGVLHYAYPGSYPAGFTDPDTTELYAGISWGVLGASYAYAVSDLFGTPDSDGSSHLELTADWEFDDGWTLNGAVGRQWIRNLDDGDYTHWRLGVTRSFQAGFDLSVAWVDTNLDGGDDAFVVSLAKGF